MKAYEVLGARIQQQGISVAELSRRVGIGKELLRRSLIGDRKISADEFIALCDELNLSLADFSNQTGLGGSNAN